MQLFSMDATIFSRKLKKIFAPENKKNHPQKLLIIGPDPFFSVLAWLPKWPKNINPLPPKAP